MVKRRKGPGWWGEKHRHSIAAKKGWKKRKAKMKALTYYNIETGGLFKPPRHVDIAEVVSFETPGKARKSAEQLLRALKSGRFNNRPLSQKKALAIARAIQYAHNRAAATLKRENLSEKERRELRKVAEIYGKASEQAWKIYHQRYKR